VDKKYGATPVGQQATTDNNSTNNSKVGAKAALWNVENCIESLLKAKQSVSQVAI
jgi:hypothetical protein